MTDEILASQREYYDERAEDYGDASKPDRKKPGLLPDDLVRSLIDEFAPTGDALEFACGTGIFTRELVRHAKALTAVDGSPKMLEINRERVGDASVTYVLADLFMWEPERTYDEVFFGCWLSHVPPNAFDAFWALVDRCLAPGGRVAFEDEDDRATHHDEVRPVDGVPTAKRTLADGRSYDIVKVFWTPVELEARLRSIGWNIDVRPVGETNLFGIGSR